MTNDDFGTTRRSVLKLAGSAAIGAAGFSSAATAAGVEWDEDDVVTDDEGRTEWILRIDRQASEDTEVTVETAKKTAWESQEEIKQSLSVRQGYTVEKQFWLANAMLVKAEKDATPAKQELSALSNVRTVHPNFEFEGPEPVEKQELVPEKSHEYTYGLNQINAPDVWEQFDTQGDGTSVAVLDTGVDAEHPNIELANEDAWAFFDADGNKVGTEPFDPNGHGTHTSGTVAGSDANGFHFGVAPETDLYHGKVLDDGGTWAQIVAGMEWASDDKDVDVINMSLGGSGMRPSWIEPVQNVLKAGTFPSLSSGNSGYGTSGSPGDVYEAFAIGASNSDGNIAGFSSGKRIKTEDWGAWWLTEDWPLYYYVPDVSAPGVDVVSSSPGGSFAALSGTSMAAPHVAGAVALMLSAKPDLSVQEAKEYFEMTAIHGDGPDANPGPRYGEGIIDVLSATTAATDENVVEGTVTYDGSPVPGVVVETDYGTHAETNEDGEFSLYLGDGEWALSVDEFGLASDEKTVTVNGGETVTQDITLADELDVQLGVGQPDIIGQGETFEIQATVANLESVTVSMASGSDIPADDITVMYDGTELTFGEPLTLPQAYDGKIGLVVEMADDATMGNFALEHEFAGVGDSIGPVTTGPTEVMADPDEASLEFVDWNDTDGIELGATFNGEATVENTGDKTAQQPVYWWLGDPNGINVFMAAVVDLKGGEETTIEFPISIPEPFYPPGTETKHGWKTADEVVKQTAVYEGSVFVFGDVDAPEQVDYGDTMDITAQVINAGNLAGGDSINFNFDGILLESKDVQAGVGGTDVVSFEFDTTQVVRDEFPFTVEGTYAGTFEEASYVDNVWVGPPELPKIDVTGDGKPATDTMGDGLLNDVNGDGEFDMADVQAFYRHLDDDVVQENAEVFNFADDSPPEVGIQDVQALYKMVRRS
jgi:subtilisin family serine protease